ncbi:hypothetical protein Bca52824_046642 [Brassica carinata]|uniref:Uncharacterized protein n=4 Tax=Brassica TaxID=3705 RepID=A0A8X7RFP3_BRACI|nr:hypothetical protein Bca52824_046642 [Brassica carinata]
MKHSLFAARVEAVRLTGSRDLDDKHRSLEVAGSDLKKKKGNEVDLSCLHKMSIEYAEAKKRSVKGAVEIVEIEDIKRIAEEKELMAERVEKLTEEWDLQKLSFNGKTKLDRLDRTQKLLKDVENDEDGGFDEPYRLLSES